MQTRSELRAMLGLAVPVVTVQLGIMAMGVVDTLMVGRVSSTDLAAVALGNLYFFGVVVGGMGVLMALDPIISQAVGAGDEPAVARGVQRGMIIAALLSVPASLLLVPAGAVLSLLRQPPEVVPVAAAYTRASLSGVFPVLAFVVMRQSLQAMHRLAPVVATIIGANVIHVLLNWMLIFGRLGCPAYGAVGAAYGTTLSRWLMAAGLLALAWKPLRPSLRPFRPEALAPAALMKMVRIGAPIGGQFLLEVGAFGTLGLLMGWLGTREIAGHQIALNLASLTFMVPLGISAAASVRVGHAVGRGDPPGARQSARVALACGIAFMSVSGVVMLAAPGLLARLYTSEPEVAALAAVLIPIAGFFQVFDGIQVVSVGVLRGLGDTSTPMTVNVLGFWIVGLPLSCLLGFPAAMGARGLWWGMVAGLCAVAAFLLLRVRLRLRREMPRLIIDEGAAAVG